MRKTVLRRSMIVPLLAAAGLIGIGATAEAAPATVPSTSPYVAPHPYHGAPCPSGDVCAVVRGSTGALYEFFFYNYGSYYLSNWFGGGQFQNNQTRGATVRLIKQSGARISCSAPAATTHEVDWDAVWRIDLSAAHC